MLASPFRLELGGQRLAAWQWGQGPAVLLVHGWQGRGAQLGAFVDPLVEAGYRVIAFDARAHGASPGARASILDFEAAILAAAEAAGGLHGLVGHSLGAAGAWAAMGRGLPVRRVALVAPFADIDAGFSRFARLLGAREELRRDLIARVEARTGRPIAELDAQAIARRMSAPLLVVHDRGDREIPWSEGRRLSEAWPGARMLSTEGLGHHRILRDPRVVSAVVDFLSEQGEFAAPGAPLRSRPPAESFGALHLL